MATKPHGINNNQNAANYINKKGINELFEAIMTALMVNKPDDHITFIRECLDKFGENFIEWYQIQSEQTLIDSTRRLIPDIDVVIKCYSRQEISLLPLFVQNNPNRIRWDLFVSNNSNTKSVLPSRSSVARNRQKPLPPVRRSNSTSKATQISNRQSSIKPPALPPIDIDNKISQNAPIILILSTTGSTRLCSRLMERYNQITYLAINDIANIDDDGHIDLNKQTDRYDCIQHAIEQFHSETRGFLIVGHLNEKHYCEKWQEKLGRVDLIIFLSADQQAIPPRNLHIIQIDPDNDFDTILADAIQAVDKIFPQNTFVNQHSQLIQMQANNFSLPIIFCIDNHQLPTKENKNKPSEHSSIDEEFDLSNEEHEEESTNSFINTLCERLAEQLSFKHIHYGDFNKNLLDFDQLKESIIESMSAYAGYIIDHFPTSFDDLQKFQREIGSCSVLIYIGEHYTNTKDDELNGIVEKFKAANKAIYINCRMEVDEIYEDLKNDIFKHI